MHVVAALEFPPIEHLIEWPALLLKGTPLEVNKVVLEMWLAVILISALFMVAARRGELVPRGIQNVAEIGIDFIRNNIILEIIGPEGLGWTPFLLAMFCFFLLLNLYEIIPFFQMPVTARMAVPMLIALLTWVIFNAVGVKHQGPFSYVKNTLVLPGVPKALLPLLMIIEFFSTFVFRPFTLAVRIFANLLAGHLLLVTFAVLTSTLLAAKTIFLKPIFVLPFAMEVAMFGFELLVAFLQAYIFTILTAVYIAGAMHPEH